MSASCVVLLMHIFLVIYMVMSNRRRRREAVERGEFMSEEERARLAEAVGMASDTNRSKICADWTIDRRDGIAKSILPIRSLIVSQ